MAKNFSVFESIVAYLRCGAFLVNGKLNAIAIGLFF